MTRNAAFTLLLLLSALLLVSNAEDEHFSVPGKPSEQETRATGNNVMDITSNEEDEVEDHFAAKEEETHMVQENSTQGKRPSWGASPSHSQGNNNENGSARQSNHLHESSEDDKEENETKIIPHHIPFGSSKHGNSETRHSSLEGFALSGRIYLDPEDKLAHFDEDPQHISLPYWDCGATGATTSPIPLKNGYFRQAMSPAPTSWSGTDGRHPILAIALSPLVIELNSGESQTFDAGDTILLEDVLLPGHRMRSLSGVLKVLYLTLPQDHYYTGKENVSLNFQKSARDACVDTMDKGDTMDTLKAPTGLAKQRVWTARRIRIVMLGVIATSFSTLAADFLGKTAPLWLAVGVGGTCFVVGSTAGLTVAGDALITAGDLWRERRKLRSSTHSPFPEETHLH